MGQKKASIVWSSLLFFCRHKYKDGQIPAQGYLLAITAANASAPGERRRQTHLGLDVHRLGHDVRVVQEHTAVSVGTGAGGDVGSARQLAALECGLVDLRARALRDRRGHAVAHAGRLGLQRGGGEGVAVQAIQRRQRQPLVNGEGEAGSRAKAVGRIRLFRAERRVGRRVLGIRLSVEPVIAVQVHRRRVRSVMRVGQVTAVSASEEAAAPLVRDGGGGLACDGAEVVVVAHLLVTAARSALSLFLCRKPVLLCSLMRSFLLLLPPFSSWPTERAAERAWRIRL